MEYVSGIESMLPANYNKLFEIEDKTSNEYVVIAFQLTADFLHIAQEAKKSGNYLMSYRFLRLANYLFPHRGDVSQKFQALGSEIVNHLNKEAQCNETFEKLLVEVKKSYPRLLDVVNQEKCSDINESVRDIEIGINDQETKKSSNLELKSRSLKEQMDLLAGKKALSQSDKDFISNSIRNAYLGQLEFVGHHIHHSRDGSIIVQFELIRKNSSLSFKGFKDSGLGFNGETFQINEIKFQIHFVQNNKVTTYPLSITVKNANSFDIWLKTMNFFNFSQYPAADLAYRNDPSGFNFHSKDIEIGFVQSPQLYLNLNQMEFRNVPANVLKNLKKVIIFSEL